MKILFWIHKSKVNSVGQAPIWVRITHDKEREQFSSGLLITINKWDSKRQSAKGRSIEAIEFNKRLQAIKTKLLECQNTLFEQKDRISSRDVKYLYFNKGEAGHKLLDVFEEHNQRILKLVGKDYSKETYLIYERTRKVIADFIKYKFTKQDVYLYDLNRMFVSDYVLYLKVIKKNQQNTVYKNVSRLKTIIHYALNNDYIEKNPFKGFQIKKEKKDIVYLDEQELSILENKHFEIQRLSLVRDLFVFQCYSGLAFRELANLNHSNIQKGIDGKLWIIATRQKTKSTFKVPLLPKAVEIMNKYKGSDEYKVFPVISNVKLNAYLKEIADLCSIKKTLTTHCGRRTFATTVTLLNGVPISTVQAMLGHSSIRTTQESYAQVIDKKISRDMEGLMNKNN